MPFDLTIQGATLLFVAACKGHISIVRYLVEKEADISTKTSSTTFPKYDGLTPLNGAVMDLCRLWEDPDEFTSVRQSQERRNAIVNILLESGADPSPLSSDVWYPI